MDCKQITDNLFAFHEGTIPDELHHSITEHLSYCASCAKLNTGFKKYHALIALEKEAEPNPFASTRILQHIESAFERPGSLNRPLWLKIMQPVAIVIALGSGILIGSYSAKTRDASTSQMTAKTEQIQFLKSDLYISEFTDEDKILDLNN